MKYTKEGSQKGSPFSMKSQTSQIADCSGLSDIGYPDTEQDVYMAQEDSVKKVKGQMSKNKNQRN